MVSVVAATCSNLLHSMRPRSALAVLSCAGIALQCCVWHGPKASKDLFWLPEPQMVRSSFGMRLGDSDRHRCIIYKNGRLQIKESRSTAIYTIIFFAVKTGLLWISRFVSFVSSAACMKIYEDLSWTFLNWTDPYLFPPNPCPSSLLNQPCVWVILIPGSEKQWVANDSPEVCAWLRDVPELQFAWAVSHAGHRRRRWAWRSHSACVTAGEAGESSGKPGVLCLNATETHIIRGGFSKLAHSQKYWISIPRLA